MMDFFDFMMTLERVVKVLHKKSNNTVLDSRPIGPAVLVAESSLINHLTAVCWVLMVVHAVSDFIVTDKNKVACKIF